MIKLLDRRLSVCTPKVDTIYKLWFAMLIKNVPHVEIFFSFAGLQHRDDWGFDL